ncbi:MAG: hypothetical protein M3P08_18475 [Thermoproteota archaeon]|nr:hypothetical protein [Thermoproteota archaeon]
MIQRALDVFGVIPIIIGFGMSRIKIKSQMSILLCMVGTSILLLFILSVFTNMVSAQIFPNPQTPATSATTNTTKPSTNSSHPTLQQQQSKPNLHLVKITSPARQQQIRVGGNLPIYGTSADNTTSDCKVSVIVNGVKPYRIASSNGDAEGSDYSKWNYTLTPAYTSIKQGQNKITAKFSCSNNPALISYNSVNVTGVTKNYNNRSLTAAIHVSEGSAHLGDKQTITLKVTDTNYNNTIAGASVIGNITKPSGGLFKKLEGTTDDKGKFPYSYTVSKGDISGIYKVMMKVSAPGYVNQSASKTFKVSAASLVGSNNISIPLNSAGSNNNNSSNGHNLPSTIIAIPFK